MPTIFFILTFASAVVIVAALLIVLIYHVRPKKEDRKPKTRFRKSVNRYDWS